MQLLARRTAPTLGITLVLAACGHATQVQHGRRLGEAMVEVGERFERLGAEVETDRWQLATYDLHELGEVFEGDVARSKWMANVGVARLVLAFPQELGQLNEAISSHSSTRAKTALSAVAVACNHCHTVAGMGFIEIDYLTRSGRPGQQQDRKLALERGDGAR